ncbi:MAG: hypothetical protein L6U99_00095 [Clostridium sp.]|nr:MAG: hypothetical protein L6U99_00095 [Clostridium sp.]
MIVVSTIIVGITIFFYYYFFNIPRISYRLIDGGYEIKKMYMEIKKENIYPIFIQKNKPVISIGERCFEDKKLE